MARRLLFVATVALSSGWIVPLYLSFHFLLTWAVLEVQPVLVGRQAVANSFSFLAEAGRMWAIAVAWLAVVTLFWSAVAARRWLFGGTTSSAPVTRSKLRG